MRPMVEMLLVVWGEPNSTDADKYLAQIAKAVDGYSDEIQRKAADHLAENHGSSRYPLPADCRKACMTIAEQMADGSKRIAENRYPEWTKQRIAEADSLIRSDMGRRAAAEGWILSLHDFCRKKQRLPQSHEIGKIKEVSRRFDHAFKEVGKSNTPRNVELRALGQTMLNRRELCANIAHGEIRP